MPLPMLRFLPGACLTCLYGVFIGAPLKGAILANGISLDLQVHSNTMVLSEVC
jgi:hypothetical protein